VKATDGTDASGCKSLVFSIKVVGPHKPTVLKTSIHSLAGDKKTGNSKDIDLIKLMPKVLDEQWHEVVIPFADLADPSLDLKKLCEIDFSVNCATNEFEFDAYVDNIGFAK
jgi:hypothetical protein